MKPPSDPGTHPRTRMVAAIERPEMRPRIRPLTNPLTDPMQQTPPSPLGSLGRYAPPQTSPQPQTQSRVATGLFIASVVIAALLGAGLAWWLRTS